MFKYLDRKDVPTPILNCFPDYKGRKFRIVESNSYTSNNYWSEGSRAYYKLLDLETGHITEPTSETSNPFRSIAHASFEIPPNHVIVEHMISCGNDMGLFIYTQAQNITKMLPYTEIYLTPNEKNCLEATKKFKASYEGVSRRQQVGMSVATWETAKAGLIEKGLMKKNGALTTNGKNL